MDAENVNENQLESIADILNDEISKLEISKNEEEIILNGYKDDEKEAKAEEIVESNVTQNVTEEDFKPEREDIVEKIVSRAEEYFSDETIFKNSFLLKHIRRNKEGYVSLKLVASMRKVKSLTKDWKVVAYSLARSKVLQLNEEKTKIRRIKPIPKIEDTNLGKTVIVFNLPMQNPTCEELKDLFLKFGNVVSAKLLTAGSENNNAYYKRCLSYHQDIASPIYAAIEFEKYEQAVSAIRDDEGHLPKENQMKVVPLMAQVYRNSSRNFRYKPLPPYLRRRNERFKQKSDVQYVQKNIPGDGADNQVSESRINGRVLNENYNFKKGNYRRPFRGRRPNSRGNNAVQENASGPNYQSSGYGSKNSISIQSRQLKPNNSININRPVSPKQPKVSESVNGFLETRIEV